MDVGIERYKGRVALVTGASSGIGAAIAQELVRQGLVVVGLARRVDRVKALNVSGGPGKLHAVQGDIAKEEDILAAFKWIKDNVGGVDVLVNNAGISWDSDLTTGETSKWKQMLDLNILGLSICTREAVSDMRSRGVDDGYIIHIGSAVGHKLPRTSMLAMYTATKHAVRALTEGLRKDLVASKSNIRNTSVDPGLVKTEFHEKRIFPTPEQVSELPHILPVDLANAVVFVLSRPLRVQIHEIFMNPTGTGF